MVPRYFKENAQNNVNQSLLIKILFCEDMYFYFSTRPYLLNQVISVPDPPSTKVGHSEPPTEGSSMTMTCDITDGRPIVIKKVTWQKGDKTLPASSHYQLSDKVLTIRSLNHTLDDGQYSCAAQNDAGMGDFSAKFHLRVNCMCEHILMKCQWVLL